MLQLRDYQKRVLDDLWSWFNRHPEGNPVVAAAVGAGKSVLIAALAQRAMREFPGTRILVLVHQKELLQQNLDKLRAVWPEAPVGVHSASIGKKEIGNDILYATIGSIYKKAHLLGSVDLILADECHLISPKETGMWRKLIDDLKKYCPHVRVIGWTGTPFRGDGVWLTVGSLFDGVAAEVTISELVKAGFLAPLVLGDNRMHMSAAGVSLVNGDYNVSELDYKVNRSELIEQACDEIVVLASQRRRWLVYCVTIRHAHNVLDALRRRGIVADMVSAKTPAAERERVIEAFRSGRLRALVNVAVLTTGFDVPEVDCIILLRNTRSPVLYVQIAGRGMRVAEEKVNCLWLDFTDTTANLGPVDAIKGRGPKRKVHREKPVKLCMSCGSINAVNAKVCIDCGIPFEIEYSDPHGTEVSTAQIMSNRTRLRYEVDDVTYAKHNKQGRPPSLRVEYWNGLRIVAREWVGVESDSKYGREKFAKWWLERSEDSPPYTVDEALLLVDGLSKPMAIVVDVTKKYPEIVGYEQTKASGEDRVLPKGNANFGESKAQLPFV